MKGSEIILLKQTFENLLRIKDLAIVGKNFSRDPYDTERYLEILELVTQIISNHANIRKEDLLKDFMETKGYITPKVGTRAAVFKNNKILLTQEKSDGLWTIPGGWQDNSESIYSNTVKEVYEETGYNVQPRKVVSIFDARMHDKTLVHNIVRIVLLCEYIDGTFLPNIETLDAKFFSLDNLPPLSLEKISLKQIETCFRAYNSNSWETVFE